jgi:hypothetical protein
MDLSPESGIPQCSSRKSTPLVDFTSRYTGKIDIFCTMTNFVVLLAFFTTKVVSPR